MCEYDIRMATSMPRWRKCTRPARLGSTFCASHQPEAILAREQDARAAQKARDSRHRAVYYNRFRRPA